jgi:pimeloyl-ACP methyl ester carboxylesterase
LARKLLKIALRSLLMVIGLVVVLACSGLAYRAYRQHEGEKALAIATANGIDEAMFVPIGGIEQWITIRGRDRNNPVLLILHGGPGGATSTFALNTLGWESDFTIVQWDQRGAGKTFGRSGRVGADVTIERMAQDGLEVAEYVRQHLHKPRIVLLGVSWGTILGVQMAKLRPDLVYAYVGTGQVVNQRDNNALAYTQLLAEARRRHDARALRELEAIGPPPWDDVSKLGVRSRWAQAYEAGVPSTPRVLAIELLAPRTTLFDFRDWVNGFLTSQEHFLHDDMSGPFMNVDLPALGTDFAVPVFVFQGADDNVTPAKLAGKYVESISAPQKQFVLIPGAGHLAMTTKSEEFLKLLLERVRPLAAEDRMNQ